MGAKNTLGQWSQRLVVGLVAASVGLAALPAWAQDPADPLAQAQQARKTGDFTKAAKLLLDHLAAHPDDARGHHELGVLYAVHGQLRDAREQFEAGLRTEPNLAESRQALADLLRAEDRCPEALPHYQKLLSDDADRAKALKGQLLCQTMLGQWPAAAATCDAAIGRTQGTELGKWLTDRCQQVRTAAQSGQLSAGQMDAEGKALFGEKRFTDSEVWFELALQTEPNADRAYRLAMARLGAGELLGCHTALQQALALEPNHQASLMALATVARALRTLGTEGQSIDFKQFDEVPEQAIGRALLADDLVLARQLVAAALPTKPAVEAPPPGAVLLWLAGELALRDAQYSKAAEWFDKALKARASFDAAKKGLADASYQLNRISEARRLAGLPPPPAWLADNADLKLFVDKRRAEVRHQLRMAFDPGLHPRPALVDQVEAELPGPPPKVEEPPPPPAASKGSKGKAAKGKTSKSAKPAKGAKPAKPAKAKRGPK